MDCRWETMFSLLELQNAVSGVSQAGGKMGSNGSLLIGRADVQGTKNVGIDEIAWISLG